MIVLQQIFGDLLRDRRPAACAAAADRLAGIVEHSADQARIIDPAMLEEGLVLGRNKRVDHQRRIFIERQFDAPLAREGLHRITVVAANIGWQRRLIGEQFFRTRQPRREIDEHQRTEEEAGEPGPHQPPHPAPRKPRIDAVMNALIKRDEVGKLERGRGHAQPV